MLDLSKYVDDKDSYISRVEISPDFKTFKVIYASGREEENEFSIHNYQVYLYRMEEQFKQNSIHYKREVGGEFLKQCRSSLIWSILDIAGMIFAMGSDFAIAPKILLTFMGGLALVNNIIRVSNAVKEVRFKGMKAAIVEAYLQHKEDFAIDVKNPHGGDEKWYVVDVNDLEQFGSIFELSLAVLPLKIPEFREDLAKQGGLIKLGGMKVSESDGGRSK